jgi:hypothetical protein
MSPADRRRRARLLRALLRHWTLPSAWAFLDALWPRLNPDPTLPGNLPDVMRQDAERMLAAALSGRTPELAWQSPEPWWADEWDWGNAVDRHLTLDGMPLSIAIPDRGPSDPERAARDDRREDVAESVRALFDGLDECSWVPVPDLPVWQVPTPQLAPRAIASSERTPRPPTGRPPTGPPDRGLQLVDTLTTAPHGPTAALPAAA